MAEIRAAIVDEPLDVGAAIAEVSAPENGGIGVFVGSVRATPAAEGREGRSVVRLEYEVHPTLAPERLSDIAQRAADKWSVNHVVAIHRTGSCELGAPTVVVACGAPHRGDALDAAHWIIDEIKSGVPIWKREVYADGSEWVGAN